MAGIVAALERRTGTASRAVARMLAVAPHRGALRETLRLGEAVLGTADDPRLPEADLVGEGDLAAAFAGRLDDLDDLAKRLERGGWHPRSMTPAGVLLAAFRAFGEAAPAHLRGVFAAVVTDGRRLWAFRDHVGFETLFFRRDGGGLYLGSEAKQVVAGAGLRAEPDGEVLEHLLYAEDFDRSRCALAGVRRLPPARLLAWDGDRVREHRYWEPERLLETADLSDEELPERFEALMQQAARRVLTGRDAVALSGGIDSPGVAAFAAPEHLEVSGRPLSAISAVYPEFPSCDERPFIEEAAAFLGLPLHTYVPRPQRLDRLQEWVALFDGPWRIWSPDGAADRYLNARSLGFRTLLTGEVAEEVMSGRRFMVPHLLWGRRWSDLTRHLAAQRATGVGVQGIARQLAAALAPPSAIRAYRRRRPRVIVPEWLEAARVAEVGAREVRPARERWRWQQLAMFQGVGTSGEANAISQAYHGVRVRSPWADVDLWELFLSLPAPLKVPQAGSKALVRRLLRGRVPDAILDRRDKTTMNEWFLAECLDYPSLRKWLVRPEHRLPAVDYPRLAERLDREDLDLPAYLWAKDLAAIHAFLSLW